MVIKLSRGSSEDRVTYTPEVGELILDTSENCLYVGDGETPGGLKVRYGDTLVNKIANDKLRVNINGRKAIFTIDEFEDLI